MSKVLVDEGVLSGCWKEVLFLIFMVLGLVEGDVGKSIKVVVDDRGLGGTGDDVGRAVRDVEERVVFDVVKDSPDRSRRWGILELGGLRSRDDKLEDMGSDVKGAWIVPSIVRALEDLEDGGGGVCNILLVNVIKGGPGGNGDIGEGGGGNGGRLRSVERHLILN